MKSLLTVVLVVAICAPMALADPNMVVIEDFASYDLSGGPIGLHGLTAPGGAVWATNNNTNVVGEDTALTVVEVDGVQAALLISIDSRVGAVSTVVASVNLAFANQIDAWTAGREVGTIYLRYKCDLATDYLLKTNDFAAGFSETSPIGTGLVTNGGWNAGVTDYRWSGVIVRMSGGQEFQARDGSFANPSATGIDGYKTVASAVPAADVWNEMWILVDQTNDRTKYFICADGGTPTQVLNPTDGSEWWYMRNENRDNDGVFNLKWTIGQVGTPVPNLWIETIAVDNTAMTTNRFDGYAAIVIPSALQADFDGNGEVDLDDFVILKSNFGTGTTHAQGDADGNGGVDLDDFVILKNEFGT